MSVKWDVVDSLAGLSEDLKVEGNFVARIHDEVKKIRDERDALRAEVERLRGDKAEVSSARLSAAFTEGTLAAGDAMRDKLRTVAERQREACAVRARDWMYASLIWQGADEAVRATPLVTEGDK